MKILAILGSPKGKGSGYKIVKRIEDRMKELGEVEFEYLFLKDANLKPCTGCYACMARGEDKCPLRDDRAAIEQKRLAADGIILSSPVFVDNVSWLMKTFIDRFAYTNHRPPFHRQKVLTVVNMAGTDRKGAQRALRWAVGGSRIVHELALATPPWPQTERAVAKKEQAIAAAAGKLYRACLDSSPPAPTFGGYLLFFMYRELSNACRDYLPADWAFYNSRDYYYETRPRPLRAAAARALVKIIMGFWKKDRGPGNVRWP